jgi:hypothetical protein
MAHYISRIQAEKNFRRYSVPQTSLKTGAFQDYVTVAERIEKFYERYPDGRIITHIIEHDPERGFILMRAEVYRDADDALPAATGHAYELKTEGYVQRTSYIEVGETSAVGRALAMAGFEVRRGIASREEMEKVARFSQEKPVKREPASPAPASPKKQPPAEKIAGPDLLATDEQKAEILKYLEKVRPNDRKSQRALLMDLTGKQSRDDLTQEEAIKLLVRLKDEPPW